MPSAAKGGCAAAFGREEGSWWLLFNGTVETVPLRKIQRQG